MSDVSYSTQWVGDLGRTHVWRVVQYTMGRRSRENTRLACRTVHNGQEIWGEHMSGVSYSTQWAGDLGRTHV